MWHASCLLHGNAGPPLALKYIDLQGMNRMSYSRAEQSRAEQSKGPFFCFVPSKHFTLLVSYYTLFAYHLTHY